MTQISPFALNTAYLLGFTRIADVRGITDTAALFNRSDLFSHNPGCGIYLLIYPDDTAYIGQCVNFIRRFKQHLERGSVINEIAFMPIAINELDSKEKELIAKAERLGISLMNIALRAKSERESRSLQTLVDEERIQAWLHPGTSEATPTYHKEYASMLPGLRHSLDLAMAEPSWFQALCVSRSFVQECIIEPSLTADYLWCAWAYTKHVTERFIPLIRLYAAEYCIFGAGYWQDDKTQCWAYLNLPNAISESLADDLVTSFAYLKSELNGDCVKVSAPYALMQHVIQKRRLLLRAVILKLMHEHPTRMNNRALCRLLL